MRELNGHTCILQLLADDSLLPCLFLELDKILIECLTLGIVCHIKKSEADLTKTSRSNTEVTGINETLYEFVRHWLTCLIVEGEGIEEVTLKGVVLHELRRKFNKVPPYVCTRKTGETGIGKHSMK